MSVSNSEGVDYRLLEVEALHPQGTVTLNAMPLGAYGDEPSVSSSAGSQSTAVDLLPYPVAIHHGDVISLFDAAPTMFQVWRHTHRPRLSRAFSAFLTVVPFFLSM